MKHQKWVLSLAALIAFAAVGVVVHAKNGSFGQSGNRNGEEVSPATDIKLANSTRGVIFGTAAINADGTVASCFNCNTSTTLHIGTGEYQVGFQGFGNGQIQANNGFSRWVQPDTLTTGSENVWCTTADRSGVAGAVYVQCQSQGSSGSVEKDASFFIFLQGSITNNTSGYGRWYLDLQFRSRDEAGDESGAPHPSLKGSVGEPWHYCFFRLIETLQLRKPMTACD